MRRCPRCNRPLEEVPPGATMRTSDGRELVFGGTRPGRKCSGCKKSPAHCDCPFERTMIEDESFLEYEEGEELEVLE